MAETPVGAPAYIDRLIAHAAARADRPAVTVLERGEAAGASLGYGELVARAGAAAGRLAEEAGPGRPILLALPAGTAFVTAFLGCLWSRTIAVPVPYPVNPRAVRRLEAAARSSGARLIVTDRAGLQRLASTDLRAVAADDVLRPEASPVPVAAGTMDDVAFLQFSSGSTREPRGIAVTQGNLAANQAMIAAAFGTNPETVGVSWLPHHHDMGLVGGILQALHAGGHAVLMDPLAFVQRPMRWLEAISRWRGTIAGGPSFGYDLCVRRADPAALAGLDLSAWTVAFCGAEPVRRQALARFAGTFAPAGFGADAFLACYGLAEATLIATATPRGQGARLVAPDAAGPVGCGPPVPGSRLHLLAEDGRPVAAGGTGEAWIGGPHVSPGIWDATLGRATPFERETRDADVGRLVPTGDLGRFAGGDFVPVDRLKDLVILNGQKLAASDVEAALLDHPDAAEAPGMAAFATGGDGGERLVILCELPRDRLRTVERTGLAEVFARHVAEATGVLPTVRLVHPGALPRTSSGKIRRAASRDAFLAGAYERLARPVPE